MKTVTLAVISFVLASCYCAGDEEITPQCSTLATVRDLTGLDGCGFVLELEDGSNLQPNVPFFCGTPPISEQQNLVEDIEWFDGKKVLIDYEIVEGHVDICMAGRAARITCMTELSAEQDDETAE